MLGFVEEYRMMPAECYLDHLSGCTSPPQRQCSFTVSWVTTHRAGVLAYSGVTFSLFSIVDVYDYTVKQSTFWFRWRSKYKCCTSVLSRLTRSRWWQSLHIKYIYCSFSLYYLHFNLEVDWRCWQTNLTETLDFQSNIALLFCCYQPFLT